MSVTPARQLLVAAGGFLLPLAIFFGWFFTLQAQNFIFVALLLIVLFVFSLVLRVIFKDSRLVGLGTTWLITGCLTVLFWALLINGF